MQHPLPHKRLHPFDADSKLNPKQQINYVIEARKRGYSLLQLEGIAKAQGATLEDLSLLRTAWQIRNQVELMKIRHRMYKVRSSLCLNEPGIFDFEEEEESTFGSAFCKQKHHGNPTVLCGHSCRYHEASDEITIDVWGVGKNL